MKKLLFIFLIASGICSAQRYNIVSGSFKSLKEISEYNMVFDYSQMQIHGFGSEEAYLEDKMKKRETREGSAEMFRNEWFGFRESKYEPAFINYLNDKLNKEGVSAGKNPAAKYTMKVNSTWLYPGYGIGIGGEPSKISATISVYETQNPAVILLEVEFDKSIGLENINYNDLGDRISGAYEKLAKNLVLQLKRIL